MPKTTIAMPFARTVKFTGEARQSVTVIDVLPVSVEMVPENRQAYDATETYEGDTRRVIVVHGGKAYEGYQSGWTGMPPDYAAKRIKSDIERRLAPVASHEWLEGKHIVDDGKAAQMAEVEAFERTTVSSRGRLYAVTPAPVVDLTLETGQVVVTTDFPQGKSPPAWMRFSLDRRADAKKMAAQLAKAMEEPGWPRRRSWTVNAMSFSHWAVKSPAEYAGIAHAHGGDGTIDEKEAAFAADLVHAVGPVVGKLPYWLIRDYADLREAVDRGMPVREPLEVLSAGLRGMALDERSEDGLYQAKLTGLCLATRLDGWEPRSDPAPRL